MEIYKRYELICEQAYKNDDIFNEFKNNADYNNILEHVTYELGEKYYDNIKKYNFNDYFFNKFMENDNIGNPKKFLFDGKLMSPSTLRYISTGCDIFEKLEIENLSIVEIGGGYGGQCKIMHDLQEFFGKKFKIYTIIDLPTVVKLQSKYLNKLKIEGVECINYYDIDKLNTKYDVCISNYGFGELDKNIQDNYVNSVLQFCNGFYIIYNTNNVNEFLLNNNFNSISEVPKTGQYNMLYYK